ncbi:hypothetical protein B0T36_05450 [Nocardia donostiensis]|uniref:hypothetical protein n=1 Tax=Nocardia donostiensis TaxID=1538463 RepID=UPI0009DAFC37|nr:hypothetical protein [Nocardia donostiensis]OQS16411.1 hypothetical protein B0T36_05450 [Nocardia donostiensis]
MSLRNSRRTFAVSALTAAALALGSATAIAAPDTGSAPLSVDLAPRINYTAYKNGTAAVITVDAGKLIVDNGQFQIRSAAGEILAGVPLEFNIDDIAFPIDAEIEGNTATLTPVLDPERARYNPVAMPFQEHAPWTTPYEREQAAWARMNSTIIMGATVGAMVGAIGAGTIGCLLGGAAGAALTSPLATLLGAGPLAGCLIGAGAFAPVGALAGSIFIGAPVAIAAFIQYHTTNTEPLPAK